MPIPEIPKVPHVPKVPSVPGVPGGGKETKPDSPALPEQSAFGTLNSVDIKKIGKGALLAAIGAAVTAAVEYLGGVDLGPYKTVVMAIASVAANTILKLIKGK